MYGSSSYGASIYGGAGIAEGGAGASTIQPAGIASTLAIGEPVITTSGSQLIEPAGIASTLQIGTPALTLEAPISAPIALDARTLTSFEARMRIINVVSGDALRIERTYSNLNAPIIASKAWLTFKRLATSTDAAAIIGPIVITSTQTAAGQITDATTDGLSLYFDLTAAQTTLLVPYIPYSYDIQVLTVDGAPYTCELGRISTLQGITVVAA